MKTKTLVLSFFACLFVLALTSCNKVIDVQIAAVEKSIDKLDENYKEMSTDDIKNTIELIEKQFNALDERKEDMSSEQKSKLSNLHGRYTRVLASVQVYLGLKSLLDDTGVTELIEYIKGLLGNNANGLFDSGQ